MPVELVPPPAALGARPRRHRRHRIGRWIAIPVAGIMTAAVAAGAFAMVYGASRSPAVREVVIDATRAATPVATPPAQDAAPSPAGVTGFTPTGIEVRKVETIIDDDRVSVVARIWNGRAEPATAMEVSFVAVGTDGGAVAEDTRVVDLAAKRGATIATDDLPIGSTEDVASVRISIHATGRSSDAIPELLVSDVRTDEVGSAVTGVLANEGDLSANATISCVVRDGSGVLVTAASDDVSVAGVASRSFRLPLTPAPPTGSSVACDAVPGAPF
jgi:hypothetical protein